MHFKHIFLILALTAISLATWAQQQVAVFSINDFHGAFVRNDDKGIVGAPSLWQTLDSLKRVYPYNVTVSAGDNFGGSYFYNATHGVLLPVLFNDLGIRISSVGNHEFDDGQTSLADKWRHSPFRPKGWDITYVSSNVRSTETGAVPPFVQPVATTTLMLPGGKPFKIAFVGLIASSTPQQASIRKLKGLSFDGDYPAVLDSVLALPVGEEVMHANLRLILSHNGTITNAEGQPQWDDKDADNLARITSRLWQGFISSHSHKRVCGFINENKMPVVQGKWHGDYISMLLCTIDTTTMQVTRVEPHSIPVSPKAHLEPGPARLQAQIDSLLNHTHTAGGTPIGTPLTVAEHNMPHNRDQKYRQSEVGTLVCKAYAEAYREVAHLKDKALIVGCSHFGSIRAGFSKGKITVLDVGETLPFSNALKVYHFTGQQLMNLVQFGNHNKAYGWLQTGNLKVKKDGEGNVVALTYVSPRGKCISIKEKTSCIVVADEFITNGGDGYSPSFFPKAQEIKAECMPATTDAFINYLKTIPVLR